MVCSNVHCEPQPPPHSVISKHSANHTAGQYPEHAVCNWFLESVSFPSPSERPVACWDFASSNHSSQKGAYVIAPHEKASGTHAHTLRVMFVSGVKIRSLASVNAFQQQGSLKLSSYARTSQPKPPHQQQGTSYLQPSLTPARFTLSRLPPRQFLAGSPLQTTLFASCVD